MDEKYLILSDIHGNVSAFDSVMKDCAGEDFKGVVLLGDCIDYGMRSNTIIEKLRVLENGYLIRMSMTDEVTYSVNTPEELERVRQLMKDDYLVTKYLKKK